MKLVHIMSAVVSKKSNQGSRALFRQYQARTSERQRVGILYIRLSFTAFGLSIFVVSELTAENHPPTIV